MKKKISGWVDKHYYDEERGSDKTGTGKYKKPFKTVKRALEEIEKKRKN